MKLLTSSVYSTLGLLLILTSGCASTQPIATYSSSQNSKVGTRTPPARSTSTTGNFDTFGDGTNLVGKDTKPGTYRTRTRAPGCYWARLAGFSGEVGDILANGSASGPIIVTIRPSDVGFESNGCGEWTSDLSAITPAPDAPFGDGDYFVGIDIAPGTWRADSLEDCYFARLRGFTGEVGDIIANGKTGIITIAKSDKGFSSSHCGTWTKIK